MQTKPSNFSIKMCDALQAYKKILRRMLSNADAKARIETLGLKRKDLNQSSDIALYQKGKKVLTDISNDPRMDAQTPAWYSGIDEFYQMLEAMLNQYHPKGNKVVNHQQEASRALVKAIQLINLPKERLNQEIFTQINRCKETVLALGSKEQREKIETACSVKSLNIS